jgi:hypothetical protein
MLGHERLQAGKAEHLTFWIMGLDQPVTVEEGCFARLEYSLLLLIGHTGHESQGHSPRH